MKLDRRRASRHAAEGLDAPRVPRGRRRCVRRPGRSAAGAGRRVARTAADGARLHRSAVAGGPPIRSAAAGWRQCGSPERPARSGWSGWWSARASDESLVVVPAGCFRRESTVSSMRVLVCRLRDAANVTFATVGRRRATYGFAADSFTWQEPRSLRGWRCPPPRTTTGSDEQRAVLAGGARLPRGHRDAQRLRERRLPVVRAVAIRGRRRRRRSMRRAAGRARRSRPHGAEGESGRRRDREQLGPCEVHVVQIRARVWERPGAPVGDSGVFGPRSPCRARRSPP